jgi:hypothetical protein
MKYCTLTTKRLLIILLILPAGYLSGIGLNIPASAVLNGNSGLSLISYSPSAVDLNPAIINPGIETSISYLYSIPDLPYFGFHINYLLSKLGISTNIICLNHPLNRELYLTAGLQIDLSYLKCGISGKYIDLNTDDYDNRSTFQINSGICWSLGNFTQSFSWLNASGSRIDQVKLPNYLISECSYKSNDDLCFGFGIEKESGFDFCYRLGANYKPFNFGEITAGYQIQPERLSIGVRFNLKKYGITYSIRTHQQLKMTHSISLSYDFKKN